MTGVATGITIGFSGWGGWRIPAPMTISLNDVGLLLSYQQGGFAGQVGGVLSIGTGADAGLIGLRLAMPYRTSAFELTYQAVAGKTPSLGALVSFLTGGWRLPDKLAAVANAISIDTFTVYVAAVSKVTAAIQVARDEYWPIVPGNSDFNLRDVALAVEVTASGPSGQITARLFLPSGEIPLVTELQQGWETFSLSVPSGDKPPALPAVRDIAGLFSSDWPGALPPSIASIGAGMKLYVFRFGQAPRGWSLEVNIGADGGWKWHPVPGFDDLVLTNAAIEFRRSPDTSALGSVYLDARIHGTAVKFLLLVPQQRLTAQIGAGTFTLGTLCEYVMDQPAPDWLSGIGLGEVHLEILWRDRRFTMIAKLAQDVLLPNGSKLTEATAVAQITAGKKPELCVRAEWVPPGGGKGTQGTLCFPFKEFCFSPRSCVDFPPRKMPPDNAHRPPDEQVADLVTVLLASGASAVIVVMAAAAIYATAVQIAAALLEQQALRAAELARALNAAYQYDQNVLRLMRDIIAAADEVGRLVSLEEMAELGPVLRFEPPKMSEPLKMIYDPPPGQMISALQKAWNGTIDAPVMTRSLATARYEPVTCARPVRAAFTIGDSTEFARIFMNAGFQEFQPRTLAPVVAAAAFDAGQTLTALARVFPGASAPTITEAMALANFSVREVALLLLNSPVYGGSVRTAETMADCLAAGYRGLEFRVLLPVLASCRFPAYDAMPAAVSRYSPRPRAAALADVLAAAYPAMRVWLAAVALGASPIPPESFRGALLISYPYLGDVAVAELKTAAEPRFASILTLVLRLKSSGLGLAQAAHALAEGPYMGTSTMIAVLYVAYTPDVPDLAFAVQTARPNFWPAGVILPLLLCERIGAGLPAPGEMAMLFLRTVQRAGWVIASPWQLALGISSSYLQVGRTLDATSVMQSVVRGYTAIGRELSVREAAAALRPGWSLPDTTKALLATFIVPPVAPGQCTAAIATAYHLSPVYPGEMARWLVHLFGLRHCPTAVGALALALKQGGFYIWEVLSVLPALMYGWTPACERTVRDVAVREDWQAAYHEWIMSGQNIIRVATYLAGRGLSLAKLVEILVGATALVFPDTGAARLATGLKSIAIKYNDALHGLQTFFGSQWTASATKQVRDVYGIKPAQTQISERPLVTPPTTRYRREGDGHR